jgi:hypothetical protein
VNRKSKSSTQNKNKSIRHSFVGKDNDLTEKGRCLRIGDKKWNLMNTLRRDAEASHTKFEVSFLNRLYCGIVFEGYEFYGL